MCRLFLTASVKNLGEPFFLAYVDIYPQETQTDISGFGALRGATDRGIGRTKQGERTAKSFDSVLGKEGLWFLLFLG
jgi:hypothetical protein